MPTTSHLFLVLTKAPATGESDNAIASTNTENATVSFFYNIVVLIQERSIEYKQKTKDSIVLARGMNHEYS